MMITLFNCSDPSNDTECRQKWKNHERKTGVEDLEGSGSDDIDLAVGEATATFAWVWLCTSTTQGRRKSLTHKKTDAV